VPTVVVSGASSGIGLATARTLAREGYAVVALARRAERLDALVAELPGAEIWAAPVDVRDRNALARTLDDLPEKFQDITALVNNAGLSRGFGPLQAGSSEHWQDMLETNIGGHLNLTSILLPRLIERGPAAHIVNLGSIAASYPYHGGNVYAATKAFVHQLSLSLRTDLQGTGVRVTCIAPGMTRTEFALVRYDGDAQRADRLYEGVEPLGAQDVADTVSWCLARPAHVNVNMIEIMPTDQPFGLGFAAPGSAPAPDRGPAPDGPRP
jgi:NADP-dependent 3-hydroxy acid dehydrogenase YdfG